MTFCKLAGLPDCSDHVPGLPGVDGVDVSELFFTKEADPTRVVGNATSPRQEIVLSSAAIIVGEWKLILPDFPIPQVSSGACRPGHVQPPPSATTRTLSPDGVSGTGSPASPPLAEPGCGYWTGPLWPTYPDPEHDPSSNRTSGYTPDTGCPETGCLFHLPSDPREMTDLSFEFPDKLRELSNRLEILRAGSFQTRNYTAGCDDCQTMQQVAANNEGFLAPLCQCDKPVVDNTRPRTDTTGAIVNAHQGGIVWHEPDRRYYWVGCAWVPCKEGPTGCNFTHIHANSTWGDCGFVRIASPAFTCATVN